MQGFKDNSLNDAFEIGFFESIIEHLKKCSDEMKTDCLKTGNWLHNHEDKITNRLINYLNEKPSVIRFILQAPENFIQSEDRYKGRLDLKAVSYNWFNDTTDYYTIECKRIDGKSRLNKEYVGNGVARFVVNPALYATHNKRNIMFGYVVQAIDIPQNVTEIEKLQSKVLDKVSIDKLVLKDRLEPEYYLYTCQYRNEINSIELSHLFYNFADVIYELPSLCGDSAAIFDNELNDEKIDLSYSQDIYDSFEEVKLTFSLLSIDLPPIYKQLSNVIPKENVTFEILSTENAIVCELICAALCHQINWDFLRESVLKKTCADPQWIQAEYLTNIQMDEVSKLLENYPKPERIRAEERTDILRKLGSWYSHFPNGFISIFFNEQDMPQPFSHIYDRLLTSSVFSDDPVEKKLQLLLLKLSGYKGFEDIGNHCKPTIDYHLIRSFLRRGFLIPKTKYAYDYIFASSNRKEHTIAAVRKRCINILEKLHNLTGLSISSINTIEWWIGRSVCTENNPDCDLLSIDTKWAKPGFARCPFYNNCKAVQSEEEFLSLQGPNYKGASY